MNMGKTAVYALGGNALSPPGEPSSSHAEALARAMSDVVDLLEQGWSVVLTHGNGPQVGALLAMDVEDVHSMDEWVAASQGMIGYQLALHLDSIFERRRRPERTAVVLTRVVVDESDEAFAWPTKPVGPVLDSKTVMSADWDIAQTVNGPRRVVASPKPITIHDLDVIQHLVNLHAVVICGGGGGVPVSGQGGELHGLPAVIDKDLFSSLLAIQLQADALIISTGVDAVYTDFGTPHAQRLSTLSMEEAERLTVEGTFPAGSMKPKVAALCQFIKRREAGCAVLCRPGEALAALRGGAGTVVVR